MNRNKLKRDFFPIFNLLLILLAFWIGVIGILVLVNKFFRSILA